FSGGALGGKSSVDIDQARRIRQAVPLISVLGGGVGNQLLPGKINVSDAYPLCAEAQHLIPESLRNPNALSWRHLTAERSYTRTDDAKDERLRTYLSDGTKLLTAGEQAGLAL